MTHEGQNAGHTTTVVWSPRLKMNLALGMVDKEYWKKNQELMIELPDGKQNLGIVTDLPFHEKIGESL